MTQISASERESFEVTKIFNRILVPSYNEDISIVQCNGGDMSYNTEIKVCLTSNTIRISKQLRIPYLQYKNIPFTIITTTKRALHMGQQKPRDLVIQMFLENCRTKFG